MATVLDAKTELAYARSRLFADKPAEVVTVADRILAGTSDPEIRAPALCFKFAALINMRRTGEFAATMDDTFEAAKANDDPQWLAQAYALASIVAQLDGSIERCVSYLVHSSRTLKIVNPPDENLAWAWHNLAMAYSYAGFPGYALSALQMARQVATASGVAEANFVVPAIRLRLALSLDHQGDSDGCVRVLRDIGADFEWHVRAIGGRANMRPGSRGFYGYASARLAAFGAAADADTAQAVELLDSAGDTVRARDLRALGRVCLAIAAGDPRAALVLLENANVAPETLGQAEMPRLAALAHISAGDFKSAYEADRSATRMASEHSERLRDLFIDGIAARLDNEHLLRRVARYAGEARTDPLTGLPNRRYLERYVAQLIGSGMRVVIGVCDLDGFKTVNTMHGHLSGDLVLQRVAGVLSREVRGGDFVARYGGDEFVVVLPDTTMDEASEVAKRIVSAVRDENWEALVPGTGIGVSVGWAEVARPGDVTTAFEAADRAMLRAKGRAQAS